MTQNNASPPINLQAIDEVNPYSGFIIVQLSTQVPSLQFSTLSDLARDMQQSELSELLDRYPSVVTRPLIDRRLANHLAGLESQVNHDAAQSRPSLANFWRFDARDLDDDIKEELLNQLYQLSVVETAYPELAVTDPDVNDADDPYAGDQGYLNAAPQGIDARWAWTHPYGRGAGIGFVDLEQGWFPNHEDLVAKTPTLIFNDNRDGVGTYKGNHGTAVLGEVVGVDNTVGIVGIAPEITSVRMVSHYEAASDTALHVADAIIAALAVMAPGDVLLLEVQRNFLPTETDPADFLAIQLATTLGIIVVEAAGNGDIDLDVWTDPITLQRRLNRSDASFQDSGAIMAGSSISNVPHDRFVGCGLGCGSNYGSRIDCYGWGENITTAGYGPLPPSTNDNNTYTSNFGGTSGASPMITGAALILQGIYEAHTHMRFTPAQMRSLLSNPATGTPQGGGVPGDIGVMPDLKAIIHNHPDLQPKVCEVHVPITLRGCLKRPVFYEEYAF